MKVRLNEDRQVVDAIREGLKRTGPRFTLNRGIFSPGGGVHHAGIIPANDRDVCR